MRARSVAMASLASLACAAALAFACGGGTLEISGGPGDAASSNDVSVTTNDVSTNDAGADGLADAPSDASTSDTGLSSDCPSAAPTQGGPCTHDGLACEYGTSTLLICNTKAKCTSGAWTVTAPQDACANELDAGGTCPAALGDIEAGSACPTFRQICDYAQGACGCGFVGHISQQWVCDTSGGAGCPSPRPKLGAACSPNGLACDYGACSILGNPRMACDGGVWSEVLVPCPP